MAEVVGRPCGGAQFEKRRKLGIGVGRRKGDHVRSIPRGIGAKKAALDRYPELTEIRPLFGNEFVGLGVRDDLEMTAVDSCHWVVKVVVDPPRDHLQGGLT